MNTPLTRWLPILQWAPHYNAERFTADAVAASVVTLMLIPQSLAYALLAGLPPEAGLYASMAPLVVYALFGTSSTLAVGPAAVTSLMTAAALGGVAAAGSAGRVGKRAQCSDRVLQAARRGSASATSGSRSLPKYMSSPLT